jgi:signal transduction histidine kinase
VFRIVDKCVHIYEIEAAKRNLSLSISGDSPRALVCDKTFPIIPTVLIENAIRYSLPGTAIEVLVRIVSSDMCVISVTNVTHHIEHLPDIFQKGVRGADDGTGHGLGLHLARLVADQHGATLNLDRRQLAPDKDRYTFTLRMNRNEK